MDVDMFVFSVEEGKDSYCMTVRYWNRFYMMMQGGVELIEIKKSDTENWKAISEGTR
jgi:hypothetical protein